MMRTFFLAATGTSYGLLAAAGVFTVLAAVGLVPRFAGKTHTAGQVLLYEEMVIFGTITGCLLSVFARYCQFGAWWQAHFPRAADLLHGSEELPRRCSAFLPECLWAALPLPSRKCWTASPY